SYKPGQSLVVKDPTGVIGAKTIQLTEMRGNERVDVWGFLEVGPDQVFLNSAYFEVVSSPAPNLTAFPSATGSQPQLAAPAPLTHLTEISKLTRAQAAQRLPVKLRGVLTYADPEWRNGFIQDKGDAVYAYLDLNEKNLQAGQLVEVIGQTSP